MITIASLLTRKSLGLLKGSAKDYTPGVYAAFQDNGDLVATFPVGTDLELAAASVAYENSDSLEDLRTLMTLEARGGNSDAAAWLTRYPA